MLTGSYRPAFARSIELDPVVIDKAFHLPLRPEIHRCAVESFVAEQVRHAEACQHEVQLALIPQFTEQIRARVRTCNARPGLPAAVDERGYLRARPSTRTTGQTGFGDDVLSLEA